ncbi:putative peptidoglycan binding protein [Nonlabens dokdonensis]|uniref:Peptidoglycan binding protein n=2 Tax=Nonlabens dokdonensis TaxID=328515 RepID=A0ABX5PYK1_9FLAO|nr:peptidoglycan-binding domain-containing protein [Nonlabens dokdonensis]AGC77081.1 putative peptidoglycan binding domain protein [Nonlabens dokdonensis DSW-6]PZX41041.1 putative peptidoglycan binding protein [Nonlabens dokdonensis]
MKQIIIFLLVLILGFVVYDVYKDWERFNAPDYNYATEETVDRNYYDKMTVWSYEEAVQDLNHFVKLQWTANDIDVRSPEDDDIETQNAVKTYSQKLAKVKYLEQKLVSSTEQKAKGLTNAEIKQMDLNEWKPKSDSNLDSKNILKQLFQDQSNISRNIGAKSALIYEVQKLLISKGYAIPLDGVFAQITSTALADFESKNNLYPDGKIDALTFASLIR